MIFVDTSAIYALLSESDTSHAAAEQAWRGISDSRPPLLTTNYVVVEATSIVQSRLGIDAVRDLHNSLLPLFEVRFVDFSLHDAAVNLLLSEAHRRLSLVDCTSFTFMRRNGIERAFAYDEHFHRFGFETL